MALPIGNTIFCQNYVAILFFRVGTHQMHRGQWRDNAHQYQAAALRSSFPCSPDAWPPEWRRRGLHPHAVLSEPLAELPVRMREMGRYKYKIHKPNLLFLCAKVQLSQQNPHDDARKGDKYT